MMLYYLPTRDMGKVIHIGWQDKHKCSDKLLNGKILILSPLAKLGKNENLPNQHVIKRRRKQTGGKQMKI